MHADAGLRRRRRMLLLMPQHRQPEAPALAADSSPAAAAPGLVDADYLSACGTDGSYQVCVEDLARRVLREQPLDGPVFQIGRGPENDLWLKHDRIQPRHLLLVRLPEGVFFVTLTPDAEVLGPKGAVKSGWWSPNLILRVGAFRLRLNCPRKIVAAEDPLAVSTALENELPRLELRFLGATTPQRPWPITRSLTLIGRSPMCKIRLDHEQILPVEAALIRTAGRLWLMNLADPERVLVNDAPIFSATLDVGDRVSFGDFRVEVQAAEEWSAPLVTVPSSVVREPAATGQLDNLVQQYAAQHQKILESQQKTLENLELLAGQSTDPALLQSVLNQVLQSREALDSEQARLQEKLQQNLRRKP